MPKATKISHDFNLKNCNLDKMMRMNTIDWKTRVSILEYETMRKEVKHLESWRDDSVDPNFF